MPWAVRLAVFQSLMLNKVIYFIMIIITFVNREEDLAFLEEAFAVGKFELVPIYGRRRIGKTELLLQFIKNKKSIYFLATAGTKRECY